MVRQQLITAVCSHKEANQFYTQHHRTHGSVTNFLVISLKAIVRRNDETFTMGYCTFTHPVGRFDRRLKESRSILEIARICFHTDWQPRNNKEKKYYSQFIKQACWWTAWWLRSPMLFVTYIHHNQSGKYLKYAGFLHDKLNVYSSNSKGWKSRPNRKCADLNAKKRFVFPLWKPYIPWNSYMDLHWNYMVPWFQGAVKPTKHKLNTWNYNKADDDEIEFARSERARYSQRWCSKQYSKKGA